MYLYEYYITTARKKQENISNFSCFFKNIFFFPVNRFLIQTALIALTGKLGNTTLVRVSASRHFRQVRQVSFSSFQVCMTILLLKSVFLASLYRDSRLLSTVFRAEGEKGLPEKGLC